MTDLLTTLRGAAGDPQLREPFRALFAHAADEIERLTNGLDLTLVALSQVEVGYSREGKREMSALLARYAEMQARISQLEGALREVEFVHDHDGVFRCPWCKRFVSREQIKLRLSSAVGHAPDCPRQLALGGE